MHDRDRSGPHKGPHALAAVDDGTGKVRQPPNKAEEPGHLSAVRWGRSSLDEERVWAIEDCRSCSLRLEQALLAATACRARLRRADRRNPDRPHRGQRAVPLGGCLRAAGGSRANPAGRAGARRGPRCARCSSAPEPDRRGGGCRSRRRSNGPRIRAEQCRPCRCPPARAAADAGAASRGADRSRAGAADPAGVCRMSAG